MSTFTLTDDAVAAAQITDACMRLAIPFRIAPPAIKPVLPLARMIYGPVIPVRHYGSVDVFFEVFESSIDGGILVIDNDGRFDEACIGDLVALEARGAQLQAIVVWGQHRDTTSLMAIGLPVFSTGAYPAGPSRLDPRKAEAFESAGLGNFLVTRSDTAFLDQDGVVFIASEHVEAVLNLAKTIRETEIKQTAQALQGVGLRQQFQFQSFLQKRDTIEGYTFRKHLSVILKSIEE